MIRLGMSRPFEAVWRALARSAGVQDPPVRWRMIGDGPWFDNQVATLRIDGRAIEMRLDKAVPVDERLGPPRPRARPPPGLSAQLSRRAGVQSVAPTTHWRTQ